LNYVPIVHFANLLSADFLCESQQRLYRRLCMGRPPHSRQETAYQCAPAARPDREASASSVGQYCEADRQSREFGDATGVLGREVYRDKLSCFAGYSLLLVDEAGDRDLFDDDL